MLEKGNPYTRPQLLRVIEYHKMQTIVVTEKLLFFTQAKISHFGPYFIHEKAIMESILSLFSNKWIPEISGKYKA